MLTQFQTKRNNKANDEKKTEKRNGNTKVPISFM